MGICRHHFNTDIIERIRETVAAEPSITRRALSLRVCDWLGWQSANGKPQEVSCRKALLQLDRQGIMILPDANEFCFQGSSTQSLVELPEFKEVSCDLDELGEIEVMPVSSRYSKASKIWNGLMDRFHYLGRGPLCGAQIRYLITSAEHGFLGGLAFSSATWRLKARDDYIGWSESACRNNLHRVVCNSRFLILPHVRVPNLASHALSMCIDRLADDWSGRYEYRPVLLESFVDPSRFQGTCYRAANWIEVGQSAARRDSYANGKVSEGPKTIYVYPLAENWQEVLASEPKIELGSTPRPSNPEDWVEEEFGAVPFFDDRLTNRLLTLARDFFAQPGELVPQACDGSEAKTKAAYRFFSNKQVDMQTLLRPHIESTIDRIRGYPLVLVPQDSTTLNYTAHPPAGVGPINTTKDKAVGLIMHDTMAFTPEGTPLGLLDVQCWARDPEEAGKKSKRHKLPIEEKESMKWLTSYRSVTEVQRLCPDTVLVSIGDREADIYELFHEGVQDGPRAKLLIRAERTRNRQIDQEHLWDKMVKEPVAGFQEVKIPRKQSRPPRTAKLEVRFAAVVLSPPKDSALPPVNVWAVYAREVDYGPEVEKPIDWMLLTTVATETFDESCKRLRWYSKRWGIEVYHRTVKSGSRIEDRRLDDANSLEACLAIDLVVAWRVYWLTMAGRETPDIPCDRFLNEDEWRVLSTWATGKPATTPPTMKQVMHWTGKLGGWLARGKSDNPGTTCMWRGLARLPNIVKGYLLALEAYGIRAGP
jgi:hypothetical protein